MHAITMPHVTFSLSHTTAPSHLCSPHRDCPSAPQPCLTQLRSGLSSSYHFLVNFPVFAGLTVRPCIVYMRLRSYTLLPPHFWVRRCMHPVGVRPMVYCIHPVAPIARMLTVCVASRLYFTFGAHNDTDDVQIKQMEELITNYGPIMYWWFDHHSNDPTHVAIDALVRKSTPDAVMLGPDSWLTGGEGGAADYPLWYAVNTTDGTDDARPILPLGPHDEGGFPDGAQFKSWEADCSFFDGCHPWFCCGTVPTHDEAVLLWDSTWGRGATLILNLPPSKDGLIEPALVAAAAQLAADRVQRYESPVASTTGLGDAPIVLDLPSGMSVSHVLLAEETLSTLGQLVSSYTLEVLVGTTWEQLDLGPAVCPPQTQQQCGGSTIGVRKVDRLTVPAGDLEKLRLTVTGNVCAKCPPPSISFKAFFF
eukprot:m.188248 g.188248  ORF g.188248 m.188248 type:complete len:421 (+) comp24818_c0_seq1:2167-3429(+)